MSAKVRRYFDRHLEELEHSAIQELQQRRLRNVLNAVVENRFYQQIYARWPGALDAARRTGDVRALPVIRKTDVLADSDDMPPYGRRLAADRREIVNIVESSGTSGSQPEVQALTADDLEAVLDAEMVGFVWGGIMAGTVVALNIPVSMAAAGHWWTLALYRLRSSVLRLGTAETVHRLAMLRRYGANQLMVEANYLRRMTYVAQAEGYELARDYPDLNSIFLGGGGWTVSTATAWAEEWDATLREQYGSSQRCFAWTCEDGILRNGEPTVIHNVPSHCLMEILDPNSGEPVEPGMTGEIVITLLDQVAMPLVRYATGDLAVARSGESCGCGRFFDGIQAGSVTRADGMLRVRGLNLWPDVVDSTVFAHAEVIDYRVEISIDDEARERVGMSVEARPDCARTDLDSLTHAVTTELKGATGLRFDVQAFASDHTDLRSARHASAKPKRWYDRRSGHVGEAVQQ